jgi:hypothetical protein
MKLEYQTIDYSGKIVTLCGSKKFNKYFDLLRMDLTMKGNLVFTPEFEFSDYGYIREMDENQIKILHEVHYAKMRKSDRILIVAPFNYVGDDTEREIRYAKMIGKPIDYITFEDYEHNEFHSKLNLDPRDLGDPYIPDNNKMNYINHPDRIINSLNNFF